MKIIKKFLLVLSITLIAHPLDTVANIWQEEIRFDWSTINLDDATFWSSLSFPKNFQWGCATSAMQIEGVQTHTNRFVKNNWTQDPLFAEEFMNNPGKDHWNRYKEDVQLIKNAGLNSYRFSIPWEKIEPCMGVYDQAAMQHYKDLVIELKKNNIEPWVCLFHFTLPVWFAELGGFEYEKNTVYFVKFCNYVFDNLSDQVTFWSTYNEPSAYVLEAYFRGTFPPHKTNLHTAGVVMKNMLNAHVEIYKNFKAKNKTAQLGLINMFHPLDPYNKWNPLEVLAAKVGNYLVHDTVLNFFKNGDFDWLFLVSDKNLCAPESLDFIGVNYYAHEMIQWNFRTVKIREGEQKVPDKNQGIYPEGLYRAIAKAAELNLPIYITENGVADSTDTVRNDFIKQHLYIVHKAVQEGYDIRGYCYWTLLDSLSWKKGQISRYGLYAVDDKTMKRTLRDGAKPFVNFLHTQIC